MLVTWKLRASPRRLIANGRAPAISSPWSRIEPRVGAKRPLIRLNSVDLPAPLGPMIAWRSPRAISSETPRMIGVAPKRLSTSRSCERAGGRHRLRRVRHGALPRRRRWSATSRGSSSESADERRRRDDPRPRRRRVERHPQEPHARPELRLRRQPVAHLDRQHRARSDQRERHERERHTPPSTPANARVRAIGRCMMISPARPDGAYRIIAMKNTPR